MMNGFAPIYLTKECFPKKSAARNGKSTRRFGVIEYDKNPIN